MSADMPTMTFNDARKWKKTAVSALDEETDMGFVGVATQRHFLMAANIAKITVNNAKKSTKTAGSAFDDESDMEFEEKELISPR